MAQNLPELLREVDAFFMAESKVHETFERLARRLSDLDVDFALAGGLAVGVRGHLRVTVDVDILTTKEGLTRFKDRWLGRGYVEKFAGSKGLRDAETGVSIDFLLTGEYPGDGNPKPVQFPHPTSILREADGYRVLDLRTLLELKLASGLSAPDRLQDFADVIALIRANSLGEEYSATLSEYVRDKYSELWKAAQTRSEP
jgi:hypothetical protein